MLIPPTPRVVAPEGSELEVSLSAVEQRLSALGEALRERNAQAIETHASELHRALAHAVNRFSQAARQGGVPPLLRRRLATASGEVAAQRESLARATAALDRAIDVLLPGDSPASQIYSPQGGADRGQRGGMIQA
jgi:alkylation response protein AidB-like acyl-CoA dehydrogenase